MRNAVFVVVAGLLAFSAWNLFSGLSVPPQVRAAMRGLKDSDPYNRLQAAQALQKIGPQGKGAQDLLIETLKDPELNGAISQNAAEALVSINADPAIAIPALVQLLENGRGNSAIWAGRSIALMPGGMELLVSLVRTKPDLQFKAAAAMSALGPDVLPRLELLSVDADQAIRFVAVNAAGRIGAVALLRKSIARC